MKKLLCISFALVFIEFLFTGIQASFGAPAAAPRLGTPESRAEARKEIARYTNWLNAKWTDDDAPYAVIRADIDAKIKRGISPDAIADSVKGMPNPKLYNSKTPIDPKTIFTYYYAKYQYYLSARQVDNPHVMGDVSDIYVIVKNHSTQIPHTYNYARLVYLIGMIDVFDYSRFLKLGERLYQRDPDDPRLEDTYAQLLFYSGTPENQKKAFELAEDEKEKYPKLAISYAGVGYLYYLSAIEHHSIADANKSISEYRQYLQIEPPYSYRADKARNGIAALLGDINIWSKEKSKP